MKASLMLLMLIPSFCYSVELPLERYLEEVKNNNQSVVASKTIVEATAQRSDEAKLIFRPSIFAQGQISVDKKPVSNRSTQGDKTENELVTAGLLQQFNFGLRGQLSYSLAHTQIYNASTTFIPQPSYNDGIAKLELTQSLWRNFAGKENVALSNIVEAQAKANHHAESFKIKNTLASAESLYWNLSQMRKIVKVQADNLERAKKITQWNQRRIESGLAEKSDLLQAQANLKLREYEYKNSLQEQNNLARAFNAMRGINSDQVLEDLDIIQSQNLKNLTLPERMELRDDTRAALEQQKLAKANSELSIQKNKPTLELYGSYAMNGRDNQKSEAISNSMKTDHSTSAIGVRFNAPLDFITTGSIIDSYKKEQVAAEYNYQRKVFDQDKEWNDLTTKFEDAKIKLSLVESIAEAQKIKSLNERDRLGKGRTTTFQVLNFEQDYAQSELLKIQSETNLINIYSQIKIFSAGGAK